MSNFSSGSHFKDKISLNYHSTHSYFEISIFTSSHRFGEQYHIHHDSCLNH